MFDYLIVIVIRVNENVIGNEGFKTDLVNNDFINLYYLFIPQDMQARFHMDPLRNAYSNMVSLFMLCAYILIIVRLLISFFLHIFECMCFYGFADVPFIIINPVSHYESVLFLLPSCIWISLVMLKKYSPSLSFPFILSTHRIFPYVVFNFY